MYINMKIYIIWILFWSFCLVCMHVCARVYGFMNAYVHMHTAGMWACKPQQVCDFTLSTVVLWIKSNASFMLGSVWPVTYQFFWI